MNTQRYIPTVAFLLSLYIVCLAFTDVWVLPWLSRKLQPPEAVFLLAFLLMGWAMRNAPRNQVQFNRLDLGLFIFIPAVVLAALFSPGRQAYLEVIGLAYLWVLYWMFSRQTEKLTFIFKAIVVLGGFLGTISVLSFLLTYLGHPAGYLGEWKLIPYLGAVFRVNGLAISPNLWATTLEFTLLILLGVYLHVNNKGHLLLLLLLLLGSLLLTFSKSIVALISVLGILLPQGIQIKRVWKAASVGIGVAALLFYVFTTQVLILSEKDANYSILKEQSYLARQGFLYLNGFEVVKTANLELKEQAIKAFRSNYGLGVGGGQFINFIKVQQEKGAYPAFLPLYDPHSTYFGLLAEAGILGILALLWAGVAVSRTILHVSKLDLSDIDRGLFWGARAYLLLLLIEAVAVDVLNFRTLWVALGILGAIFIKYERKRNFES